MPGYYIHLAACGGQTLKNRSFVLGVEAPDLLKKHVRFYGEIEKAKTRYESLRTSEMPEYSELQPRIVQKERADSNEGLHYGLSSNPNIMACWSNMSEAQKNNPFYRGYIWHLLTDAIVYGRLDFESKFYEVLREKQGCPNFKELQSLEVKKLHADWDKTNALVRDYYSDIVLPVEIKELGVVQFIDKGDLVYVDWNLLKYTIDYLRTFDPLNGDMNYIIENVLKNI